MSQARIQHFLLVFDHEQGQLLEEVQQFGTEGERAVAAYTEKELIYRNRPRVEIVLIGSDSLATVRLTHANYFDGTVASPYLAGIP